MLQVVIQKIPENLQEFEILAAKGRQPELNCTPFVRQYDIMSNRWGDFNAKGYTKQTIHTGI